jgi:anion-transporting  ArsA/GET3 family ATPase
LLGSGPIDEEIQEIEPNLWVVNMNPRAAIREIGMMVLRYRTIYRAVLENRWVRRFLRGVPALEDYSMLGKAWYHTTEQLGDRPKYETVIFDGPATGNLISMLRIPQVILDAVPTGPLTADAKMVDALLRDSKQTGMWIVTLAEEMPASEAVDLYRVVREELGISADRLVVNMVYPDALRGHDARDLALLERVPPPLSHAVASARTLDQRRKINDAYLARLQQEIPVERLLLPHLFVTRFNRSSLDLLTTKLEAAR